MIQARFPLARTLNASLRVDERDGRALVRSASTVLGSERYLPMNHLKYFLPVLCVSLATSAAALAQQPTQLLIAPLESPSDTAAPGTVSATTKPAAPTPLLGRWLDLKTLSHSERYRNAYDEGGYHVFEDGQQRSLVEGHFKFDSQARYIIGFRASSGRFFNWAYADYAGAGFVSRLRDPTFFVSVTPAQIQEIGVAEQANPSQAAELKKLQSNGWQFYVRELSFSATPVKAVTVEFGSFGIERGDSTEITTFDDDGFLSGERVRINDPKHLFFDQVGFTSAFFGDVGLPNLFVRGSDFKTSNYRQVFARKALNQRVGFSGEYTWQLGTDTLREAAVVGTKELKVADSVRFEAYERLNTLDLEGLKLRGASGFAVTAEKKVGTHLAGDFGFDSVDKDYSLYYGSRIIHAFGFSLNGDTYGMGNRAFMHASYKINPFMSAFGFYTHAVGDKVLNFNQQGLNAGVTFDLKALANTERLIF